jgi:cyclopropane-fatty-acyl-phospholipid synthase
MLALLFGSRLPVRFTFWDGSALGPEDGPGVLKVHSADAIRRVVWAPGELGLSRAYVAGDIDLDGDIYRVLRVLHDAAPRDLGDIGVKMARKLLPGALRLGLIGRPLRPPKEEAHPVGKVHSRSRDAEAISHHYDVGNDFYRLVLGPSMTYSCARYTHEAATLEDAQEAKHDLICRKLGLHERTGSTLLDVGCGWGSMALHAASRYGAKVVGVTLSHTQAELAQERAAEMGLGDQVEIRLQDYRELSGERFDAISSVGMFEHVGASRAREYFEKLWSLLSPGGRFLNHAISTPGGTRIGNRSFIGRYVFPDGELIDVGEVVLAMQRPGFEVRDVESLREHYSKTLHAWVANLQSHWEEAMALVGPARARVWLLYMAASANGFDDGGLSVHQVLAVKPFSDGSTTLPPTRRAWM